MIQKKKTRYSLALKDALENPPQSSPVVAYRAELEWKEGIPFLVSAPVKISEQPEATLRILLRRCLDLPYDGKDPSFKGLSQGEAMIIQMTRDAANGDSDARTQIIDRILGRPQQNIKSVNLSGDLNDFLDKVARETQIQTVDITPNHPVDLTEDL